MEQIQEPEDQDHPIFTKDPNEWMELVHCFVSVETKGGKNIKGYVFTIDPVSESIVLVNFEDEFSTTNTSVDIVMKDSVVDIEKIHNADEKVKKMCSSLFRQNIDEDISESEMVGRRDKLKLWLEKNRFPVSISTSDDQVLQISDALMIQPPYTDKSCLSTNEIILSRVQQLIKNMPVDF